MCEATRPLRHVGVTHVTRTLPGGRSTPPPSRACRSSIHLPERRSMSARTLSRAVVLSAYFAERTPCGALMLGSFVSRRACASTCAIKLAASCVLRAPQHGDRHGLSPTLWRSVGVPLRHLNDTVTQCIKVPIKDVGTRRHAKTCSNKMR